MGGAGGDSIVLWLAAASEIRLAIYCQERRPCVAWIRYLVCALAASSADLSAGGTCRRLEALVRGLAVGAGSGKPKAAANSGHSKGRVLRRPAAFCLGLSKGLSPGNTAWSAKIKAIWIEERPQPALEPPRTRILGGFAMPWKSRLRLWHALGRPWCLDSGWRSRPPIRLAGLNVYST
jgi:hypothetical protein